MTDEIGIGGGVGGGEVERRSAAVRCRVGKVELDRAAMQQVSKSTKRRPSTVWITLPGWGSPWIS